MTSKYKIYYRDPTTALILNKKRQCTIAINENVRKEIWRFKKENPSLNNAKTLFLMLIENDYRKNILLALSKAIIKENNMKEVLDYANGQLSPQERVYYNFLIQRNLLPEDSNADKVPVWWIPNPKYLSGKKVMVALTKKARKEANAYKKRGDFCSYAEALALLFDEFINSLQIITKLLKSLEEKQDKETVAKVLNELSLTLQPSELALFEALVKDIFPQKESISN